MRTGPTPAPTPGRTRPEFRRLAAPVSSRGANSFFGTTNIYGPLIAGDYHAGSGAAADEYRYALADVFSVWRNQYILGPASATEAPFIPTDNTAIIRRRIRLWPGAGEELQRRPVDLPEAIASYRRIVLLGRPGGGKSSYLQYLALRQTGPEGILGLLPVLVELNQYHGDQPFLEFIRSGLRQPPNPDPPEAPSYVTSPWLADNLETWLEKGRILLLIDGLNELPRTPTGTPGAALLGVQQFFRSRPYARVRAVVTCRMLDYEPGLQLNGFQTVLLDPWGVKQMTAYLQQQGELELLRRIEEGDPLLLSLGQVPFLLYMLTELAANYRATGGTLAGAPFLASESALFGEFIELLLDWANVKVPQTATWFPRTAVLDAFGRLAAAMQAYGYYGTAVPYAWAGAQLPADPQQLFGTAVAPFPGDPRERLLALGCDAAILDASQTRQTVRFWHRAHQDYFVARALSAGYPRPAPGTPAAGPAPEGMHEETSALPDLLEEFGGQARGRPHADRARQRVQDAGRARSRLAGASGPQPSGEARSLAAGMDPDPQAAVEELLAHPDPRAGLWAARAWLSRGGQ